MRFVKKPKRTDSSKIQHKFRHTQTLILTHITHIHKPTTPHTHIHTCIITLNNIIWLFGCSFTCSNEIWATCIHEQQPSGAAVSTARPVGPNLPADCGLFCVEFNCSPRVWVVSSGFLPQSKNHQFMLTGDYKWSECFYVSALWQIGGLLSLVVVCLCILMFWHKDFIFWSTETSCGWSLSK